MSEKNKLERRLQAYLEFYNKNKEIFTDEEINIFEEIILEISKKLDEYR